MARLPISLYPGMRDRRSSCFEMLSTPADRPYGHGGLGSKYQGQSGPTPSQYWRNFDEDVEPAARVKFPVTTLPIRGDVS